MLFGFGSCINFEVLCSNPNLYLFWIYEAYVRLCHSCSYIFWSQAVTMGKMFCHSSMLVGLAGIKTCPNHFNLFILYASTIVFSNLVILLSYLDIPEIDLRYLISKTFSLFLTLLLWEPYVAIGVIKARKSLIFNLMFMFPLLRILL